ncbi:MAG: MerR family transcriptional regulator [Balneola sp.]|nr:MAG: MerR family transcriptional regulator [Balneola sp.]
MEKYSVSRLASLAGITIRTLHHYDKIGLLKPANRSAYSNYRYYGEKELHRLQQILFFKELGFPLKEIKPVLDDPNFDQLRALKFQRIQLLKQTDRLQTLIQTIDKTINNLEEDITMNIQDLYDGFSKEEVVAMYKEVEESYDKEVVTESWNNIKAMGVEGTRAVSQEMETIAKEMSTLIGSPLDSEGVIALMKRQHRANEMFYKTSAEIFKGLGDMYVSDPKFSEFYDKHAKGTAQFMRDAMYHYAEHRLNG